MARATASSLHLGQHPETQEVVPWVREPLTLNPLKASALGPDLHPSPRKVKWAEREAGTSSRLSPAPGFPATTPMATGKYLFPVHVAPVATIRKPSHPRDKDSSLTYLDGGLSPAAPGGPR